MIIAMDRASVRRFDADGHLHVETSHISKANVCPYYGHEIPDADALGLDANAVYQLLRDPDELARAAPSLNGKPLLIEHKPTTADDHQTDLVVGAMGSDASFDGTYLNNTFTVWAADAIAGIESNRQRQLSAGYRYRADMTPGEFEGLPYDGKMTDISFNHVALVIEGRAGPDVVVGDEIMKLKSRTGLMLSGAIVAHVAPKLKSGTSVDISSALGGVTGKSIAMDGAPKKLAADVAKLAKGKLANDADLDVEELEKVIEAIQSVPEQDDEIAEDESDEDKEKREKAEKDKQAKDAEKDDKPAMDSATVERMIAAAVTAAEARSNDAHDARRAVQPFVGEVAMDSAPDIYKLALDQMKVDLTGVPPEGYKAMFNAMAKMPKAPIALDAAAVTAGATTFATMFPNAAKLGVIAGGN